MKSKLAFAVLALTAVSIAALNPTTAAPITYDFSPSVMGSVLGGTETISGSFTFDQTLVGNPLTAANVTVTGPAFPGTYGPAQASNALSIELRSGNVFLEIGFANNLGNAPDNVDLVDFFGGFATVVFIPTQGTAVPASSAVPEPASLVLLGTALVGFGVMRRRRRNV